MSKPRIAVFSGPRATIANTPVLVTSNKGRAAGEQLDGRFDHLVPQRLHEPVRVRIEKFSAHPLESDAAEVYHDDGKVLLRGGVAPGGRRVSAALHGAPRRRLRGRYALRGCRPARPGHRLRRETIVPPRCLPAVRGYRPRVGRARPRRCGERAGPARGVRLRARAPSVGLPEAG